MPPSIRLLTEIPGPRSRELMARRDMAVARGVGYSVPVFVESASGALVTDVDGNVLIDFAGGIGTMNVGHCHPEVVAAAQAQLGRLGHTCFTVAHYEPYVALAEALNRLTPGNFPKKTFLANLAVDEDPGDRLALPCCCEPGTIGPRSTTSIRPAERDWRA